MARRSSGHGSLYRIPGLPALRPTPLDMSPDCQSPRLGRPLEQLGVTGGREVLHPQCDPGYDLVPLARVSQDSLPPWQFVNYSLNPEAVGTSVIPAEEMVFETARRSSNTCSSPSRL
jgi:hypothetical protein